MFTEEELKNLAIFLNRVDLKGSESFPHAMLLSKINQLLAPKVPEEVIKKVAEPCRQCQNPNEKGVCTCARKVSDYKESTSKESPNVVK